MKHNVQQRRQNHSGHGDSILHYDDRGVTIRTSMCNAPFYFYNWHGIMPFCNYMYLLINYLQFIEQFRAVATCPSGPAMAGPVFRGFFITFFILFLLNRTHNLILVF